MNEEQIRLIELAYENIGKLLESKPIDIETVDGKLLWESHTALFLALYRKQD